MKTMFLISEYCAAQFYSGWHLYLRESPKRQQPNSDGNWGWVRRSSMSYPSVLTFLKTLGIESRGDDTCDDGAGAELARRFPIPSQRIGGKPRGCIEVQVDERGDILGNDLLDSPKPNKG